MKQVAAVMALALHISSWRVSAASPFENSRQCLVVSTDSWSAPTGTMSIFERESTSSQWTERAPQIPVVIGKAGLGWGRGLTAVHLPPDPEKREGDNRAPAGIFKLHSVFGYAPQAETKMAYRQVTANDLCVDDPQSQRYNQLIDKSKIDDRDWRTAEEMLRRDHLYKWGVLVDHNVSPPVVTMSIGPVVNEPHGSCIFLHVWRGPGKPTVGCTAMSEKNILRIIKWLDPAKNPLLVQMPNGVYKDFRPKWNLP